MIYAKTLLFLIVSSSKNVFLMENLVILLVKRKGEVRKQIIFIYFKQPTGLIV
jgi:hypothetical protein